MQCNAGKTLALRAELISLLMQSFTGFNLATGASNRLGFIIISTAWTWVKLAQMRSTIRAVNATGGDKTMFESGHDAPTEHVVMRKLCSCIQLFGSNEHIQNYADIFVNSKPSLVSLISQPRTVTCLRSSSARAKSRSFFACHRCWASS